MYDNKDRIHSSFNKHIPSLLQTLCFATNFQLFSTSPSTPPLYIFLISLHSSPLPLNPLSLSPVLDILHFSFENQTQFLVHVPDRIMSCNGCRILRKGCNDNCVLRQSLQGIESPQAQANATVFVAKFFGRAGLMSILSSVPETQRPALFQSLLFEACGRTVNPVNGAVGLLWTRNWHLCQSAVETVLRGGLPRSLPEFSGLAQLPELDQGAEANNNDLFGSRDLNVGLKRKWFGTDERKGLDLQMTAGFPARMTARGRSNRGKEKRRPDSPSDESETTTLESGFVCGQDLVQNDHGCHEKKLLRLFF